MIPAKKIVTTECPGLIDNMLCVNLAIVVFYEFHSTSLTVRAYGVNDLHKNRKRLFSRIENFFRGHLPAF